MIRADLPPLAERTIKAWIFDIDNTLYDYDAAHEAAFGALTDYARDAFGLTVEEFDALHRAGDRELRRRVGAVTAAIHDRLLRYQVMLERIGRPISHAPRMADLYWSVFFSAMEPYPGAAECLASLKDAGLRVGVGTNMTASHQFVKLERLGVLDTIDFLVTSEEVGVEKPDAKLFACCVEKAGCLPGECAFVGDSLEMDVLGARAAGLVPVWLRVRGGDGPAPPGAAEICSLEQIREMFRP